LRRIEGEILFGNFVNGFAIARLFSGCNSIGGDPDVVAVEQFDHHMQIIGGFTSGQDDSGKHGFVVVDDFDLAPHPDLKSIQHVSRGSPITPQTGGSVSDWHAPPSASSLVARRYS